MILKQQQITVAETFAAKIKQQVTRPPRLLVLSGHAASLTPLLSRLSSASRGQPGLVKRV